MNNVKNCFCKKKSSIAIIFHLLQQDNRLVQLLSNISAERLHQFYNANVLESSLKACRDDNIQCDVNVTYEDNSALVDLLYHQVCQQKINKN